MRFAGVLISGVNPNFFAAFFANIFAFGIPNVAIFIIGNFETVILEIMPAEQVSNVFQ